MTRAMKGLVALPYSYFHVAVVLSMNHPYRGQQRFGLDPLNVVIGRMGKYLLQCFSMVVI